MSESDGLVVVGSGPAGATAAAVYRHAGGAGPVRIISADPEPPYARPPLSKEFLRAESGEEALSLYSPDFFRDRDIELHRDEPVDELLPEEHTVRTRSGQRFGYGSCVLAVGARPIRPRVPGA